MSNWETYKDILESFNSDKAIGSAVRESKKDVESWTGQVNVLKNNWNEFVNSIINSNTAIDILKSFNGVLNALQASTKGLGGLGTLSTLIAGFAGMRGTGIVSTIQSMVQANKTAISIQDVAALRQYNALLAQGVSMTEAQAQALNEASVSANRLAVSMNGAAVSEELLAQAENKVTLGAKAGATAAKVFGTAINAAINMGVIALISLAVKGLSKLADSLITTQEELDEARQKALQSARDFQNEADALDDVVSKYYEIISSTTDLNDQKEQLVGLQEQVTQSYKDEADGIDLVNGKISENLRLLDEQRKKEAENYIQNNRGEYEQAVEELTKSRYYGFNAKGLKSFASSSEMRNYLLSLDNVVKNAESHTGLMSDIGGDFYLSGTYEQIIGSLSKIRDYYAETEDHESRILAQLDEEISSMRQIADENKEITNEFEKRQKESSSSLLGIEYSMIEKAVEEYKNYQEAVKSDDARGQSDALGVLNQLRQMVDSTSEMGSALREEFDTVWNTFNLGAVQAISNIDAVKSDFDKFVDEAYSAELKNLKNIESAIDTFLEDGTISHDEAWALFNIDTEKVLTDIQIIDGEYKLSTDQLLKLMQNRIDKQKESIQATKTEAQEELALAKTRLASIKINSLSDMKYYEAEIKSILADMETAQDVISQSDYLLMELNGHLSITSRLADATAKSMQNAVKNFEAEVDAIDNAIDSLNDRKDVLESEKDSLQDQLDILNEQKETIEQTIKNYDTVADAVSTLVKKQTDAIQEQIDAMEEAAEAIKKDYDDQISSLEEQNEERDDAIRKEKALADLQNAQNQKKRVYSSEMGWTYESSKSDILAAQKALADINNEMQIKTLEKERDAKLDEIDSRKEAYTAQIKAYEEYAQKYADVASNIKQAESDLIAEQILGSEWRTKIEQMDEELLTKYSSEYVMFNTQLNDLVNNEIASLQESIDAKDEEIKKIDDEIKAYNKYKTAVQTNLKDAKSALESYQQAVSSVATETNGLMSDMAQVAEEKCGAVADSVANMENSIWNNHNKILDWIHNVTDAMSGLLNETNELRSKDDFMNLVRADHSMGYYADGGVNNYTGIAMLHGTKQKSETIFNANDSKKLYDMIHGTPNLLADAVKRANKITGFSPVNNNNTNSISVSIGQVVANNPQEFTRGLDRELDQYFRRKLTESYVQ